MALDVTSRSSLSNSSTEPLQSLINGPINSGSIEHLLHTYSNQIHQHRQQSQHQQQQPLKSMEDATLFLKAAAAAAAAAAAVSASENAASPSPTISSLPESSKSPTTTTSATKSTTPTLLINNNHSNSNNFSNHSPPSRSPSSSFDRQQSLDSDDNMGRPDSISPPQPLALTGRKQLINFNQNHDSRVKSPKNSSLSSAAQEISPLEKLQSLCPNTLMFQSMINNHHNNLAHHFNQLNHETNRALKFSIDNILSPEFGRSEAGRNLFYSYYQQFQERYSCYNLVKSSSSSSSSSTTPSSSLFHSTFNQTSNILDRFNQHLQQNFNLNQNLISNGLNQSPTTTTTKSSLNQNNTNNNNSGGTRNRKLSFDINALVSTASKKRKRSDSESSSVSSLSNNSKDISAGSNLNNNINNNNENSNSGLSSPTFSETNNNHHSASLNEDSNSKDAKSDDQNKQSVLWPAWVYCTRYSDRPSSGPRSRKIKKKDKKDEKRPRTAFTAEQLARLKQEFNDNKYLTEKRRQDLARELKLNESQIKIWFQNKRAKIKKSNPSRGPLALHLMAQGLYNHSTMPIDSDDELDENYKAQSPGLSESSKTSK